MPDSSDGNYIIFREVRDQNEEVIPLKKADLSSYYWNGWFTNAALAEPIGENDDSLDSVTLVRDLTDEDPRVRRNARDALIALGPAAIQPMTQALRKEPDDYKVKLGTVIVMNGMLRNDEHIASKISENLNAEDIHLLVNALSDSDKTIRLQATEFLYALKDKRTVESSLYKLRTDNNENGIYNIVLVLKEIVPLLDSAERLRVRNEVVKSIPVGYVNTRALAITIDP